MKSLVASLASAAAIAITAQSISAATLVTYTFPKVNNVVQSTPVANPDVTATSLTYHNGGNFGLSSADRANNTNSGSAYAWSKMAGNDNTTIKTNLQDSVDGGYAFSFTLTPGQNQAMAIDSYTVDLGMTRDGTIEGQNTYAGFIFVLRSSLTGTTDLGTKTGVGKTTTKNAASATYWDDWSPTVFDLSGFSQLQNVTSAVTFNLYVYYDQANSIGIVSSGGRQPARIDNVVVGGEVSAIPEPSSALLLTGSAVASLLLKRRRVAP